MKKPLALLLALLLTLNCVGAFSEIVTATGRFQMHDALLEFLSPLLPLQGQALLPQLQDAVNRLTVRLSAGERTAILEALLDGAPALAFKAQREEDGGLILISDLFPHCAVTVSPETVQMMLTAAQSAPKAGENILPQVQDFLSALLDRAGDMEMGEYSFSGGLFDLKIPIVITGPELAEAAMDFLKGLSNSLPAGLKADPEAWETAEDFLREQLEGTDVDLALYGAVDQENGQAAIPYAVCVLENEGTRIHLEGGAAGGNFVVHVESGARTYENDELMKDAAVDGAADAAALDVYLVPGDGALGIEVDVFSQVFLASVTEILAPQDEDLTVSTRVYIGTAEAPVWEDELMIAKEAGEIPPFDPAGYTRLAAEDLWREWRSGGDMPLWRALAEDAALSAGLPFAAPLAETEKAAEEAPETGDADTEAMKRLLQSMFEELEAMEQAPQPAPEAEKTDVEELLDRMLQKVRP